MNYATSYPNIFTQGFYEKMQAAGHYNPLAGTMYYENQLVCATSADEELPQMKAQNEAFNFGNEGNPVSISLKFSFFNAPALSAYLPPDGAFYWTWRSSALDLIQRLGTPSNSLPADNSEVITFERPTNSDYFYVKGFSQGWQIVLDTGSYCRVINYDYWTALQTENEELRIYKTERIVGCYSAYTSWDQAALDDLTAASYRTGFTNGKIEGQREANVAITPFTYIRQAGDAIGGLFDVEVLPHLSIGVLICIPLVALIFAAIVRILKK